MLGVIKKNIKKIYSLIFKRGYIIPFICSMALFADCIIISHSKYLWMDEFFTYYPASLQSFLDMIAFITDKINAGSYLYFILVWFWVKIFSLSELSLRLFSSIGFSVGIFAIWTILRKTYGYLSSSLATIIVCLSSTLILYQNSEARFYGLLFAITSILLYITINNKSVVNINNNTAITLFILNGLLPLTHPFGFAYSLLFLMVVIILDLKTNCIRWKYYISSILGWTLFVPFIPAFQKAMELGKPHFWIPKPSFLDLKNLYKDEYIIFLIFFTIIFITLVYRYFSKSYRRLKIKKDNTLFIGIIFFIFPVIIWVYSQFFQSLFTARYVIIFEIGLIIIIASVFSRIFPSSDDSRRSQKFLVYIVFIILLLMRIPFYITEYNNSNNFISPGSNDSALPSGIPIVIDSPHPYLPKAYYNPAHRDYYFVLDQEVSLVKGNALNASQDFQAMDALKNHIEYLKILRTDEILNNFPQFIVLSYREWFNIRIRDNNNFYFKEIEPNLYLVTNKNWGNYKYN